MLLETDCWVELDKDISCFTVVGAGRSKDRGYVRGAGGIREQSVPDTCSLESHCEHTPLVGGDGFSQGPIDMKTTARTDT